MDKNNYNEDWAATRRILIILRKIKDTSYYWIDKVNKNREGKYSSTFIAWCAAFASAILLIIMLFVPPYLGMSDDGTFSTMANPVGIYHIEDIPNNLYFNYYVKKYLSVTSSYSTTSSYISSPILFIRIAKTIDTFFTHDDIFDMRFLALLYTLLFIPTIALIVKQALRRIGRFSEAVVIAFAGVLIFTDVSYVTYFSSFYAEPAMYISFLLCVGSALALQDDEPNTGYLLLYTVSGILLTTAKQDYALIGVFLAIFCVRFIFIKEDFLWRAGCITSALILFISMMLSTSYLPSAFTQASKYHAMTRGVLLQSADPEKALEEFGIDSSYSILADTDSNDTFPFIDPSNKVLDEEFYNKYNTFNIAFYYFKHPNAMLSMLDISVKSAFNLRRGLSGNYEKTANMPKLAKSLFWSMWSNFKSQSAPKTIGFIILLLIAMILLFRQTQSPTGNRYLLSSSIPFETMMLIFFIGLSQAALTILKSGDAEMSQHLFLFSVSIDLLCYFCFSEVLHKLNVM